ncbi:MAG: hypothetical protein ACPGPS_13975 [Rubripirellula sp.]
MWVTVDGERRLGEAESRLFRRAVASMLSNCVAVLSQRSENDQECRLYGIDWFDQWEAEQKVWLLEQVATALLTDQPSLRPAAMWEATVDAIFLHVFELVVREFESSAENPGTWKSPLEAGGRRWRDEVIQALEQQQNRRVSIETSDDQVTQWRRLVMQISDRILGVATYQSAESYRDEEARKLADFLQQKGLPDDFLTRIPPLLKTHEIDDSIERLQRLLAPSDQGG